MIELLRRGFDEEVTHRALAEALRRSASVSNEQSERLAAELAPFVRAIPDALRCALAMSKDPRCGRAVAFATGAILNYLFDEDDLLPESSFGAIGLLDDAYLVHAFVGMLIQTYPFVDVSGASYAAPDRRSFEIVDALLPEGVTQALLRTCESTIQVARAFSPPAHGLDAVGPGIRPAIRIDAALKALGLVGT